MAEIKDKVVTVESLSALHEHNKETYMTKVDPVGSGSFSMNRKANGEVGDYSTTLGSDNIASGSCTYAEGLKTIAKGVCQHVQGCYNIEDDYPNNYLHIVGNGVEGKPSNAHTIDWEGNTWYAGNLNFDGNLILTSNVYGDELPAAGTVGRIFFKKISE